LRKVKGKRKRDARRSGEEKKNEGTPRPIQFLKPKHASKDGRIGGSTQGALTCVLEAPRRCRREQRKKRHCERFFRC